jgi:hypothetical protein
MAVTSNYGAAPTYEKIASQTLASATASVTFSNIPQGYTDLIIEVVIGNSANGTRDLQWKLNGDSGSNYSSTSIESEGSAVYSGRDTNFTYLRSNGSSNNTPSNYTRINFMNYSNATTFKSMISRSHAVSWYVITKTLLWRNTSPITSIVFTSESSSNFVTGSTFNMYGIKAAIVPKASGGDIIVNDGTYWIHTYKTSGLFFPKQSLTADILVVAGGGGASGYYAGSGGGAGGFRTSTGFSVSTQPYAVTVGAGGAGAGSISNGNDYGIPGSGSNSIFSTITSTGGGYGSTFQNGANGGSGGGGGYANVGSAGTGNTPSTSPSQGNDGAKGSTDSSTYTNGGAGGGAGAAASAAVSTTRAGNGGNGSASSISGSSVTYAGGGGGAAQQGSAGTGGTGGGGAGVTGSSRGNNGTANLGGGGGGGNGGQPYTGGNGGSGIVIVRYPI